MSRYQQIRVRIEPYYKNSLKKDFPKLHRLLCRAAPKLEDQSPPLFELVPILVRLSQEKDLGAGASEAVYHHGQDLTKAYQQIEEAIGSWKLGDAEKLLSDMDEDFEALEKDLPKDE